MKLAGKINCRELKDYGKGKDAEAREVVVVSVRLDGRVGLPSGRLEFALTDEEIASGEFELGESVVVDLGQPQQKMKLGKGKGRRESAPASH